MIINGDAALRYDGVHLRVDDPISDSRVACGLDWDVGPSPNKYGQEVRQVVHTDDVLEVKCRYCRSWIRKKGQTDGA